MSTSTGKTSTGAKGTVRPGLRTGEHVVAVQFSAWGPQEVAVCAYGSGGRGGAPYVVVQVGTCLTYAYDQAVITVPVGAVTVDVHTTTALRSYLAAWRKASTVPGRPSRPVLLVTERRCSALTLHSTLRSSSPAWRRWRWRARTPAAHAAVDLLGVLPGHGLAQSVVLQPEAVTIGVLVLAIVSTCSRSPARREHSRQLIRELASFAKVLRSGEPVSVGTDQEPARSLTGTQARDQPDPP